MTTIDDLLQRRMSPKDPSVKVKALAKQSSEGALTSFSGLFKIGELSDQEKGTIEAILLEYQTSDTNIQNDLTSLISLTAEVKAIDNQAALLHGERIARAQALLKSYREGAFTAWLYTAYGNRQTPYNFLLYFQFFQSLPGELKTIADGMPRQAVYTLAGRDAPKEEKLAMIRSYKGETKREFLEMIRAQFPIRKDDKRRSDHGAMMVLHLKRLLLSYKRLKAEIDQEEKEELQKTLRSFLSAVKAIP